MEMEYKFWNDFWEVMWYDLGIAEDIGHFFYMQRSCMGKCGD